MSCFDAVVQCGLRRAGLRDENRLSSIFRHELSPSSRLVRSPRSGLRFRPGLHDLRPVHELVKEQAGDNPMSSVW